MASTGSPANPGAPWCRPSRPRTRTLNHSIDWAGGTRGCSQHCWPAVQPLSVASRTPLIKAWLRPHCDPGAGLIYSDARQTCPASVPLLVTLALELQHLCSAHSPPCCTGLAQTALLLDCCHLRGVSLAPASMCHRSHVSAGAGSSVVRHAESFIAPGCSPTTLSQDLDVQPPVAVDGNDSASLWLGSHQLEFESLHM